MFPIQGITGAQGQAHAMQAQGIIPSHFQELSHGTAAFGEIVLAMHFQPGDGRAAVQQRPHMRGAQAYPRPRGDSLHGERAGIHR